MPRTRITRRAIPAWPNHVAKTEYRSHAKFKARWDKVLSDLDAELSRHDATNAVIEIDCPAVDIRKEDGQPKADARTRTPGVILTFEVHHASGRIERRIFPCDTYYDWQDNVRAISLTLDALRAVDRYGAAAGKQWEGFKALPAAVGAVDHNEAAEILCEILSETPQAKDRPAFMARILGDADYAKITVRRAIARVHPDQTGGDRTRYDRVDAARKALTSFFGVSV